MLFGICAVWHGGYPPPLLFAVLAYVRGGVLPPLTSLLRETVITFKLSQFNLYWLIVSISDNCRQQEELESNNYFVQITIKIHSIMYTWIKLIHSGRRVWTIINPQHSGKLVIFPDPNNISIIPLYFTSKIGCNVSHTNTLLQIVFNCNTWKCTIIFKSPPFLYVSSSHYPRDK